MKTPMLLLPSWSSIYRVDAPMKFYAGGREFKMAERGGDNYFAQDGIAYLPVIGPMIAGAGTYGGVTDQQDITAMADRARTDPSISGAFLYVDSPGGTVASTADLGDALARFAAAKPLVGFAPNLAASAGYWALSQANKIFSGRTSIVGSIGVITELVDASALYEKMGVKVIPIVTGKMKGIGDESQPVTQEAIDYTQSTIDALFEHFLAAVSSGRGKSKSAIKSLEAAVFVGEAAVEKGLTDKVGTADEALASLHRMIKAGKDRKVKAQQLVDAM